MEMACCCQCIQQAIMCKCEATTHSVSNNEKVWGGREDNVQKKERWKEKMIRMHCVGITSQIK